MNDKEKKLLVYLGECRDQCGSCDILISTVSKETNFSEDELLDDILNSLEEKGYVCVSNYPKRKEFGVCITDRGMIEYLED